MIAGGGEKDHLEQAVGQRNGPRRQIGEGPAVSQSCDEPPWLREPPLPTLRHSPSSSHSP